MDQAPTEAVVKRKTMVVLVSRGLITVSTSSYWEGTAWTVSSILQSRWTMSEEAMQKQSIFVFRVDTGGVVVRG